MMKMAFVLHLETSTNICSVALSDGDSIIDIRESSDPKSHASLLAVFVKNILEDNHIQPTDLAAVAVSMGPGSYTGLRIGVSTAKGIAYGANIKLVAVNTLQAMVEGFLSEDIYKDYRNDSYLYVPLIDAKRMEVYSAVFDSGNNFIRNTQAEVIGEGAFDEYLQKSKVVFFGNGAQKCKEVIKHPNALFVDDFYPSAKYMIPLSSKRVNNNLFEDVAYFEPFYLKDFIATVSKKNIL